LASAADNVVDYPANNAIGDLANNVVAGRQWAGTLHRDEERVAAAPGNELPQKYSVLLSFTSTKL
jgi:hypothetical protein